MNARLDRDVGVGRPGRCYEVFVMIIRQFLSSFCGVAGSIVLYDKATVIRVH